MNRLAPLRRRRRSLGWVAICVLVLHALVPAGFMPVASEEGGLTLMPCPGTGPVLAPLGAVDPHAHHHRHHGSSDEAPGGASHEDVSRTHALCVFAAAASPAIDSSRAIDVPVIPASMFPPLARSRPGTLDLIARAQSARAPPA